VLLILVATGLLLWHNDGADPNLRAQRRAAEAAYTSVPDCVRRTQAANAAMNPSSDPSKQNWFDHGTGGAAAITAEDYCQQVIAIVKSDGSAPRNGFIIVNGRVARAPDAP
jgi:hypothetical protein